MTSTTKRLFIPTTVLVPLLAIIAIVYNSSLILKLNSVYGEDFIATKAVAPSLVGNHGWNTTSRSSSNPRPISCCIGMLQKSASPIGIVAWLRYYQERWGLTHAEIFIVEESFNRVRHEVERIIQEETVGVVNVNTTYEAVPDIFTSGTDRVEYENGHMINKCLYNAKRRGSAFHFGIGESQFLVSSQYNSFEEIFSTFDNHDRYTAISFPTFKMSNQVCSHHVPSFGSATYRSVLPKGANLTFNESIYTMPPPRYAGRRRYVLKPETFFALTTMHEPDHDFKPELDLTGRASDNQDVKLLDFGSTGKYNPYYQHRCEFAVSGTASSITLSAPNRTSIRVLDSACPFVYSYEYQDKFASEKTIHQDQQCLDEIDPFSYVYDPSEVNQILAHVPLSDRAIGLYEDSVCFVKRYPELAEKFCPHGLEESCNHQALRSHFERLAAEKSGKKVKYGCR